MRIDFDFWTWFKPQLPGLVLLFGLIGLTARASLLVLGLEGPSFIAAPLISTAICTFAFLFKRLQHADVVADNFLTISPHGVTQETQPDGHLHPVESGPGDRSLPGLRSVQGAPAGSQGGSRLVVDRRGRPDPRHQPHRGRHPHAADRQRSDGRDGQNMEERPDDPESGQPLVGIEETRGWSGRPIGERSIRPRARRPCGISPRRCPAPHACGPSSRRGTRRGRRWSRRRSAPASAA